MAMGDMLIAFFVWSDMVKHVLGVKKPTEKTLFSDMPIVGSSRHILKKSPLSFTILHSFLHVYITFSRSFSACMRSCDNLLG